MVTPKSVTKLLHESDSHCWEFACNGLLRDVTAQEDLLVKSQTVRPHRHLNFSPQLISGVAVPSHIHMHKCMR